LAAVQWAGAALILAAVMAMLHFQNTGNVPKTDWLQPEKDPAQADRQSPLKSNFIKEN
jgi:hypothetical protein